MRAIKSVPDSYKGYFTFLLAFIVFYSGSLRGLLAADLSQQVFIPLKHTTKNHTDCNVHQQHATVVNAVNQSKTIESEIDEVHLDFILSKSVLFDFDFVEKQIFNPFFKLIKRHKLPLYDLFCNWKFHLG